MPSVGDAVLPEEADWIAAQLRHLGPARLSPLLNIGSGSRDFRDIHQPFMGDMFRAFEAVGGKVLHADLRAEPGVDFVGNLRDPGFVEQLRDLRAAGVLANNLLEHVHHVQSMADVLASLVPEGGHLIVTGPLAFPYHPDPIDNGLRLTPEEAAALFPTLEVVNQAVVESPRHVARHREWLRGLSASRRVLRRLYWAKEAVVSREGRRVQVSNLRHHWRTPTAFALVLQKVVA